MRAVDRSVALGGHIQCERALLAQADLLLLVVEGLRGPTPMQKGEELAELLEVAFPEGAGPALESALGAWRSRAAEADGEGWTREQHRLFEGAQASPINQTAYVRRDKGAVLADLCGFYRAFGFEPRPGSGEKADHLGAQLEFAALLLVLLARAQVEGREEAAAVTREALADYATDHLAPWLTAFSARLHSVALLPVHAALAELLEHTWRRLAAGHGWPEEQGPPLPPLCEGDGESGFEFPCLGARAEATGGEGPTPATCDPTPDEMTP